MAIKVNGTTVINDSRALNNIASIDATTATAISDAGVGGGGWALDSTVSITSGTTSLEISIPASYSMIRMEFVDIVAAANSITKNLYFRNSGDTADLQYDGGYSGYAGSYNIDTRRNNQSAFPFDQAANDSNVTLVLRNPNDATPNNGFNVTSTGWSDLYSDGSWYNGGGAFITAGSVSKVKLTATGSGIASGTIYVYGLIT